MTTPAFPPVDVPPPVVAPVTVSPSVPGVAPQSEPLSVPPSLEGAPAGVAPTPPPTRLPTAPPPPAIDPIQVQREQALDYREMQIMRSQLDQELANRRREMEARGFMPEEVSAELEQLASFREEQFQARMEKQQAQRRAAHEEAAAKVSVANLFADQYKQYGITPQQLMTAQTVHEMQVMVLIAENQALKARSQQVPQQSFNSNLGNPAAGNSDAAFMQQYTQGLSDDHARAFKIYHSLK